MSEIFFTSDTHFFHKKIIQLSKRPFDLEDVDTMNETLIQNWNDNIRSNDMVYFCGDFSFGRKSKTLDVFSRLNGRKVLIEGNHEESAIGLPWFEKHKYLELNINKKLYCLFHYPIVEWNKFRQDYSVHLYGHTHELRDNTKLWMDHTNVYHPRAYHVGVDSNNYSPIHIEDINKVIENRLNS